MITFILTVIRTVLIIGFNTVIIPVSIPVSIPIIISIHITFINTDIITVIRAAIITVIITIIMPVIITVIIIVITDVAAPSCQDDEKVCIHFESVLGTDTLLTPSQIEEYANSAEQKTATRR